MLWALFFFGATETQNLYRLFLALTIPVALVVVKILRRPSLDRTTLIALLIGLLLAGGIAFQHTVESRGYIHLWVAWAAFFIFNQLTREGEDTLRLAVACLLVVGGLEGAYGLVQVATGLRFGIHPGWMPDVATGTLYNRNHFAGMMNMLFPLSLGVLLAFYQRGLRRSLERSELFSQTWLLSVLSGLLGFTILLSGSRAGLASLVAALLFVSAYLRFGTGFGKLSGAWKLAVLVLLLIVALGLLVGFDSVAGRLGSVTDDLRDRLQIYRDTVRMIVDHPLGAGPGMYAWTFRPYQSVAGRTWYDYAHNDYLQTTAEWGIPLALIFWIWVFGRLRYALTLASACSGRWLAGVYLGCAAGALTMVMHSLVDFNLYIPTNAMLFMALLAIPYAPSDSQPPIRSEGVL